MMSAASSDVTFTLSSSVSAVSPGSCAAARSRTSREVSSRWVVASRRTDVSPLPVSRTPCCSSSTRLAVAVYVFGSSSESTSTVAVSGTTMSTISQNPRRSAAT